jgi:hypothetical protein
MPAWKATTVTIAMTTIAPIRCIWLRTASTLAQPTRRNHASSASGPQTELASSIGEPPRWLARPPMR